MGVSRGVFLCKIADLCIFRIIWNFFLKKTEGFFESANFFFLNVSQIYVMYIYLFDILPPRLWEQ